MTLLGALRSKDPAAVGYIAAWKFLGLLPSSVVRQAFEFSASRLARRESVVAQLRLNLARVVGETAVTEQLVAAAMRSYARYWAEAFQLPRLSRRAGLSQQLERGVTGAQHLDASLSAGRGAVIALTHSGNWDMAGVWLVHHVGGFTTVAERLKPEVLFDAFVEYRTALGFEVIGHEGDGAPFDRLKAALERGGIVCLLGERDLKQAGVPVQFFGEETTFPAGPAELARQTGAALHVADIYFTPDGWGLGISAALEVSDLVSTTQDIATHFERNIKAHPADWHMLQPLWLKDRRRK
ncbi:phosphatidylinositol mannoside acyltransferase [Corynebacterium sp. H128]|uniref:phosphatidylinositol mannoside acyltransferase n=1 Tax=unclassified Corynebacterium TaxID=2624378 RepID=UPI0030ADE91A